MSKPATEAAAERQVVDVALALVAALAIILIACLKPMKIIFDAK